MFVGCKLPHGHTIEHKDETIVLNGANVGFDGDNPWRNGVFPDAINRTSGAGLTELVGKQAEAFKDWFDVNKSGGPIKAGMIFYAEKAADTSKEAAAREDVKSGTDPLDPAKDMPKGVETAKED